MSLTCGVYYKGQICGVDFVRLEMLVKKVWLCINCWQWMSVFNRFWGSHLGYRLRRSDLGCRLQRFVLTVATERLLSSNANVAQTHTDARTQLSLDCSSPSRRLVRPFNECLVIINPSDSLYFCLPKSSSKWASIVINPLTITTTTTTTPVLACLCEWQTNWLKSMLLLFF